MPVLYTGRTKPKGYWRSLLMFYSLPVTVRATRFNVKKFCMLITLHLCVLCGCQKKK